MMIALGKETFQACSGGRISVSVSNLVQFNLISVLSGGMYILLIFSLVYIYYFIYFIILFFSVGALQHK